MSPKTLLLALLLLPVSASAQSTEILYEGMGMKLESLTDAMTDERSCVLFIDQGPVYFALYGHNLFTIWAEEDSGLNFSSDSNHMIRVGEQSPYSLTALFRRNGLKPANATQAAAVVRALLEGERMRYRYYDWPSYDSSDREVDAPNVAYAYNIAVERCGWRDLGVSGELGQAELSVYLGQEGYVAINVVGNDDLRLRKGFDQYGGGCHIQLGVQGVFGRQAGNWTSEAVDRFDRERLVVFDADRNRVYSNRGGPSTFGRSQLEGHPWPQSEAAARAAWEAAPDGSIELENSTYAKRVSLYGFHELWRWGVENCGFPSVE